MTKNTQKIVKVIDLGLIGKDVPIGLIEAIQKNTEYFFSCEVISFKAEMIRIKIDTFYTIIKSNNNAFF